MCEGSLHLLVGVRRREPDVDDGDVRGEAADLGQQLGRGSALGRDLHTRVREQPGEAVTEQDAAFGDHHPELGRTGWAGRAGNRWAFQAVAATCTSPQSTDRRSPYADLGASSSATYWALLTAFAVAFAGTAYLAVRRRVAHETR